MPSHSSNLGCCLTHALASTWLTSMFERFVGSASTSKSTMLPSNFRQSGGCQSCDKPSRDEVGGSLCWRPGIGAPVLSRAATDGGGSTVGFSHELGSAPF